MALAEGDRYMGSISDSTERPRFSLFHRGGPKMRRLPNGEKIPIVTDINAFAAQIVVKEMEREETEKAQGQQPIAEQRRPLARIRNMVTGLVGGVVR